MHYVGVGGLRYLYDGNTTCIIPVATVTRRGTTHLLQMQSCADRHDDYRVEEPTAWPHRPITET